MRNASDIADHVVGLTAVHVNRTLKALEREGLLRRDKRSGRVVAWKHLQNAGDFGTRYLHLENQRTAWMTGGPPSGAKRARASLSEANGSLASD